MEIAKILSARITVLKNMRLVSVVTLLLLCAGCASIARIDGPYEGKVVDAETNQPIEGAVVHGTWYRVHATPAGSSSEYYDSNEVLTDKNGEFRIPGKGLLVLSNIDQMIVTIFKSGYEQIPPCVWSELKSYSLREKIAWENNKATLKLQRLSMEERRKRGVTEPDSPGNKQRLFRLESNKENIEIGRPVSTLYHVE